jgi:glycosyltransferase involved in cell wall biosynthesis
VIISQRADPSAVPNWFTKLRDFLYNFADGYVFQTALAKSHYNKRIQARAVVIQNPVIADNIPTKWVGDKEDIIVNVGRFELKQKRQDILIRAFAKIADKHDHIRLVLYGDGEDKLEIIKNIADCNLDHRIVLAGVTKNIYESIAKAKIFVLSSDYEGIPNALIEAMSVGLPCISTDYSRGGVRDLIRHMENGLLVKRGCVEELADAMDFMLSHPELAETMGQKARSVLVELDPDRIINQWEEYIDKRISAKLCS